MAALEKQTQAALRALDACVAIERRVRAGVDAAVARSAVEARGAPRARVLQLQELKAGRVVRARQVLCGLRAKREELAAALAESREAAVRVGVGGDERDWVEL